MKNNTQEIVFSNYIINAETNEIIKIDKQFTKMTGYTMTEIEAKHITQIDLIPSEDIVDYAKELKRQFDEKNGRAYIWHRLRCKDDKDIFVFCYGEKQGDGTASVLITDTTFVREMADEKEIEAEKQNELLKLTMESEKETLYEYDVAHDRVTISHIVDGQLAVIYEETNYSKEKAANQFIHPDDMEAYFSMIPLTGEKPKSFMLELRVIGNSQRYEWNRCNGVCVYDKYGRLTRVVGKFREIADDIAMAKKLKEKAERDELTGLYHHADLMRHVDEHIGPNVEGCCAMFVVDLDDFKMVNDAFGHHVGDEVLTGVGKTLMHYAQERGLAGRIGADEFTVFLWDVKDREDVERHMLALAKMLQKCHEKVELTCSIGASLKTKAGCSPTDLYIEADRASYEAKRRGHGKRVFFDITQIAEAVADEYIEEEELSLNEIDGCAYIADAKTYELLYMNENLVNQIKTVVGRDKDYKGKKCYEVCMNRSLPCTDCNMAKLKKNESVFRQHVNEFDGKQYICKDSLINFGGKNARLEIALDVTTQYSTLQAIQGFYESNEDLRKCIHEIANTSDAMHEYEHLLRFVALHYSGECCGLIERHEGGALDLHEWRMETGVALEGRAENPEKLEKIYRLMKECANEKGRISIENMFEYREKNVELYEQLMHDKVWTLMGNILYKNGEEMGCLYITNPKKHMDNTLLISTISTFMASEINRRLLWDRQQFELTHDPLTGVFNRGSYMNALAAAGAAKSVGLASVDVNSLTRINNDFGLAKGNQVICEIADMLRQAFDESQIFRFHSDDFTILVTDEDRDSFSKRVEKARELFDAHESGACIGYVWDDFDMDIQKMSQHADELLMLEKQKFHESDRDSSMNRQKEMLAELKSKIAAGQFAVYLQPKVYISDQSYYGAEALIRALEPDGSVIPPMRFIPVLEKTGTIQVIDFFVFEEICKMIKRWVDEGTKLVPISFNFSRLTLLSPNLVNRVEEIVRKYEVPKAALEIEITETIGDLEYDMISRIANDLRGAGYRLSMDDFGTKYSSISTLSIMHFDMLKIDRSMVNNLEENEISRQVMKHVIAMCKDLDIECIAEGVETHEQADLLTNMDCLVAQGYLYGKPMPMAEFEQKYKASINK